MSADPLSLDSLFDASRRAPRLAGRGLIKAYQYTLSPLVGFDCRHLPTCSDYADQAIERYGLWAGGWMTLARLLRCQPFGTSGLDFVAAAFRRRRGGICRGATRAGAAPTNARSDATRLPGRKRLARKSSTLTCARSQE